MKEVGLRMKSRGSICTSVRQKLITLYTCLYGMGDNAFYYCLGEPCSGNSDCILQPAKARWSQNWDILLAGLLPV